MNQQPFSTWQFVALLLGIVVGSLSVCSTILIVGWNLRGYFSKLEVSIEKYKGEMLTAIALHKGEVLAELSSNREVISAQNRRIERMESKLDIGIDEKYRAGG